MAERAAYCWVSASQTHSLRMNAAIRHRLSVPPFLHRLLSKQAASSEQAGQMTQEDLQDGGGRFPPTRRSVIEAVRSIDAEEHERALEALCAAYWQPVYKYVRWPWTGPP